MKLDGGFDVATLLAQDESGSKRAKLRCSIENGDGEVIQQSSASGAYAICDVTA
jgi:hypothetical protein